MGGQAEFLNVRFTARGVVLGVLYWVYSLADFGQKIEFVRKGSPRISAEALS